MSLPHAFLSDQLSFNSLPYCKKLHITDCPLGKKTNKKSQSNLSLHASYNLIAPLFPALPSKLQVSLVWQVPSFAFTFLFPLSSYMMSSCSQQSGKRFLFADTPPETKCRGQTNPKQESFSQISSRYLFNGTYYGELQPTNKIEIFYYKDFFTEI